MVPPGYVDITTALYSRGSVNVIGVVVDVFGDVFRTGGSSVCITFTLKDTNLENGHSWDGLKIKYFNDDRASLPPVKERDVVLLQDLRVRTFNGKTIAVASQHETVPWAIYRQESDARTTAAPISGPDPFEPSHLEKKYALALLKRASSVDATGHLRAVEAYKSSQVVQASVPTRKPGGKQFSLIKDIEERTYVILVCEVLNISVNDSEKLIIDVTDYTSNESLSDDEADDDDGREGDSFNYLAPRPKRKRNGPLGRMTLRITLWDPHAAFARVNIRPNHFVHLNNVHIKRGRIYKNLEASIHTDRHYPDKVCITKVNPSNDERARALLDRRKEYWAKHYSKEDAQEENTEKPANSKKAKQTKPQKKQEKKNEEGQNPLEISKRTRLNVHIKAMNVSIKCKRLEDILTNESHEYKTPEGIEYRLPFQNICYRSDIRVVDFFPPNLEDFAVPEEPDSGRLAASDGELDISSHPKSFTRWEWRFCLLVENSTPPGPGVPKERIRLYVSGPDAECLLGLDPVDLRKKKASLRELKEKLFILWGDLEERKSQAAAEGKTDPQSWGPVSSVPFTCCIKEYGVRCSHVDDADDSNLGCENEGCFGWERRLGMFQTTIHS